MSTRSESGNIRNPQPLLASENDSGNVVLLGGGAQVPDIDPSPLERLIAQSTSDQAAAAASSAFLMDDIPSRSAPKAMLTENAPDIAPPIGSTVAILIAGTFSLLQVGLVWASFFSDDWFETHLLISATSAGETGALEETNSLQFSTDQKLQSTTLASILSMLLGADQHWAAMTLVLTCLIFPCLCMILCPSWIVEDYQLFTGASRHKVNQADLLGFSPRAVIEYFLVRTTFLAFFLLAILDVGTSSLALENSHTEFVITNRIRGGLVCYTLGMTCALGVIVILRVASCSGSGVPIHSLPSPSPSPRFPHEYNRHATPRAPPRRAFRRSLYTPLLPHSNSDEFDTAAGNNAMEPCAPQILPFWKKVFVYEFGLLATTLWLPALFLPLFRLTFSGLLAAFMEEVSFVVPLYQIPIVLWQRGSEAGTDHWILIALGQVLLLLVYILPLCATGIAIAAWNTPFLSKAGVTYLAILRYIQPCLCGLIFSLSLLMAVPSFESLGDYILDTQTSGLCQKFESITDTHCLTIEGEHGLGQWVLLTQSIALEVFVWLTLSWKK